jgi:hypothetical protein
VAGAVAHAAPVLERVGNVLPAAPRSVVRSLAPAGEALSSAAGAAAATLQHAVPRPAPKLPVRVERTAQGPADRSAVVAPAGASAGASAVSPSVSPAAPWLPPVAPGESTLRPGVRAACASCGLVGFASTARDGTLSYGPFAPGALSYLAATPARAEVPQGAPAPRHAPAPVRGPGEIPAPSFAPAGGGGALALVLVCLVLACVPLLIGRLRPAADVVVDVRHVLILERPG